MRRFVEACRHTRTILPATTTIERICADALVDAERRIEARIAERVPPGLRRDLEHLLEETVDAGVTRFVWLRHLGLRKMAEATTTHGFWELMRIARWHVEGEAYVRALSMVVEAQAALPMAAVWGTGRTASSDGQFFPAAGRGEALNLVNARYGTEPGVKAYSHVSDRFSPFATQTIPATVHEAPYILDGLLMNETGRRVREQYADTGGFTDHVFAACSILGYTFVPRTTDPDMRRRAQVGLNKGEAHHALKRAINFHQRGERRPRRPGRIPGPRLAARMGTHQPDRRMPVARCRPTFNVKTLTVGFRPLPQTTRARATARTRRRWPGRRRPTRARAAPPRYAAPPSPRPPC